MAEGDKGLTVAEKEQRKETNHELETLKKAVNGEISWFSKEPLMVASKFGMGGGVSIILGRYLAQREFPTDTLPATDPNHDAYAVYKQAAAEVAVGLGLASALRKVSPIAAAGSAIVAVGDAIANIVEPTAKVYLDEWFSTTPATGALPAPGAAPAPAPTGTPGQGVFFRRAR